MSKTAPDDLASLLPCESWCCQSTICQRCCGLEFCCLSSKLSSSKVPHTAVLKCVGFLIHHCESNSVERKAGHVQRTVAASGSHEHLCDRPQSPACERHHTGCRREGLIDTQALISISLCWHTILASALLHDLLAWSHHQHCNDLFHNTWRWNIQRNIYYVLY